MRLLSLLGAVVVVVGASGCGGGGSGTERGSSGSGNVIKTVTIDESEFKLAPSSVTLSKPGTYEFKAVNKGTVSHALEIEGNGVEEEMDTISPGSSAKLTVDLSKPGTYELYCPIDNHRQMGMQATVVVGGGGAGGGGTTTEETKTESSGGNGY